MGVQTLQMRVQKFYAFLIYEARRPRMVHLYMYFHISATSIK